MQLQKLCYGVALLACLDTFSPILIRPYVVEKCQPPSIRTDTVLFTLTGILLWAQITVGFEDIFFSAGLYNQIQCMLLTCSMLDCQVWWSVHLTWKPVSSEISCLLEEVVKTWFTIFNSTIFFVFELFRMASLKSPVGAGPSPVCVDS